MEWYDHTGFNNSRRIFSYPNKLKWQTSGRRIAENSSPTNSKTCDGATFQLRRCWQSMPLWFPKNRRPRFERTEQRGTGDAAHLSRSAAWRAAGHRRMGGDLVDLEGIVNTCGNCKWMKIDPYHFTKHTPPKLKAGAIGLCKWPTPTLILPLSITKAFGYRPWGDDRSAMRPKETGCPTWEGK